MGSSRQLAGLSSPAAAAGRSEEDSSSTPVHLKTREYAYEDEGQATSRLKFVSRERRIVPRPPFYRPPIYFPNITLQMLKLSEQQRKMIKETGWAREVAFKTSPNVTKLEIKGILEGVYGMEVERVHTMNYLGRKYVTYAGSKRPVKQFWRADDWKKAYVIFKPPAGMQLPRTKAAPRLRMLDQLLAARGLLPSQENVAKPPPQEQQQ